jgi:hypothetical protein
MVHSLDVKKKAASGLRRRRLFARRAPFPFIILYPPTEGIVIVLIARSRFPFGVTMDYLVDEESDEMTPVSIKNKSLANRLELLEQLETEDQQTIINVIDSMLTKKKMLDLLTKKEQVVNP